MNHLEAHLYAAFLEEPDLEMPLVVLLVSGGHTMLIVMEDHLRYRVLGSTLDDAAGGAFDKVARFMDLGYPGGPVVDRLAIDGDPAAIRFPRAMANDGWDFSFSGLKTAVVNHVRKHPDADVNDVAASFQEAVADVRRQGAPRRAGRSQGVVPRRWCRCELSTAREGPRCLCGGRLSGVPAESGHVHRQRSDGGGCGMVASPGRWPVATRYRGESVAPASRLLIPPRSALRRVVAVRAASYRWHSASPSAKRARGSQTVAENNPILGGSNELAAPRGPHRGPFQRS